MTYARPRSLSAELHAGSTDGSTKKVVQGRGGFPETTTADARRHLADTWYGIHMDNEQVTPDACIVAAVDYVPTRPVHYPGG